MKTIYWVAIIIFSVLLPIAFMIIVPILIFNLSWWWLWGTLIVEGIIGGIVAIIFLIIKLSKKSEIPIELKTEEIKKKVVIELKNDEHDPDNFIIEKTLLWKVGEKGAEKTPILILFGKGTETNTTRVAIINLKKQEEITWLKDPKDKKEIEEWAVRIAETHEEETKEEITTGTDIYGRPQITTKIIRPSTQELQKQKEKEEAESRNII